MKKIEESLDILKSLGLPEDFQNQVSALTLLALAHITPKDEWSNAKNIPLGIARGIMDFARDNYNITYKENSRETFRKQAITPFLEYNLIEKNPNLRDLGTHSSKTNYALNEYTLSVIKKYNTPAWKEALEIFRKYQEDIKKSDDFLLTKLEIRNFKSILDDTIELGRINVFIGANGCGKTNILETIAFVGASKDDDLSFEGLLGRGFRIAKPSLIFSSFLDLTKNENVEISLSFGNEKIENNLTPFNPNDIYSKWINSREKTFPVEILSGFLEKVDEAQLKKAFSELLEYFSNLDSNKQEFIKSKNDKYGRALVKYLIYDLNTVALRGLDSQSRKTPLGIYGESLDVLLANFNSNEQKLLNERLYLFEWLDHFIVDKDEKYKSAGHKLGKSVSNLYFMDKFMQDKNNIFSAENANEGILHVLFYFALFISSSTPKLFAIDNIETALNPRLCRVLMKELCEISKITGKQALITTHNPAILDGLNILDDEQRLFEVYRTDDGYTKTRRINIKKDFTDKQIKLSEMWMNGLLGAIPQNF